MGSCSDIKRKYKRALFTGGANTAMVIAAKHTVFINSIIYPTALITPVFSFNGFDTGNDKTNLNLRTTYRSTAKFTTKDNAVCVAQQLKTKVVSEKEEKIFEEMTDEELEELAKKKIAEGLSISQDEIKSEE